MGMRPVGCILFLLFSLVVISGIHAENEPAVTELYLKNRIFSDMDRVSMHDIIDAEKTRSGLATLSSGFLSIEKDRLMLIPLRLIRTEIKKDYSGTIILVGKRLQVIPEKIGNGKSGWFYSLLSEHLEKQFPDENMCVSVEFLSYPDISVKETDSINLTINKQTSRYGLPGGLCTVNWEDTNSSQRQKGVFDVIIHAYAQVLVPKYPLRAGEIVSLENTTQKEVDLGEYPYELLFPANFVPVKAVIDLVPGEPILQKQVTKNIIVRAGERVTITFQRKNLVVSMTGRALSSGSFDEVIQVRPDGTGKSFTGSVSGKKEVRIEFR
ncbi:MAG: flagellar basal body P-ring formation protein FlgA [Spirochaetales bacterium]|nr:flagellar basal body P-ring formation protein FlgA [Spirochaetales bacterium]